MIRFPYIILIVGWAVWMLPFLLIRRRSATAHTLDRRARWGIVLQVIALSLLWQNRFWDGSFGYFRVATSFCLFVLAGVLSWTGVRALGRHWRIDAGLNRDHELVRSGPYRVVRHPIYASMLCVLLGTGVMLTPSWLLRASLVLFLIGTEIRIRIEDALLASTFGEEFDDYRRTTPAYIPFVR